MDELKFQIIRSIGELSVSNKGWMKEVNIVSWNERPAKVDIREWDPSHEKMKKGVTLTKEEAMKLKELLNSYLLD